MRTRCFPLGTLGAVLAIACGSEDQGAHDAGPLRADASSLDASLSQDSGPRGDATAGVDADSSLDGGNVLGEWVSLAPLARGARQETAVVALEGEIYVIGGFNERQEIVRTVEVYDPASDRWRDEADLPVALHHANAAVSGGRIYIAGFLVSGFAADGRTFEYDKGQNAWMERAPLQAGRQRGAAATVALNGFIYVIGGLRGLQSVADVDEYDPGMNTWRSLPPLPRISDHVVVGAIRDKIYVAGGRSGGINGHTDRLDIFEPASGMWTVGPMMPTSRGGHAASVAGERLYVFGGEGDRSSPPSFVFDETEMFDPVSATWRSLAPMRTPRHGTGAATVGERVYVPGGADAQAFSAVSTNEAFLPPP